MDTDWEDDEVFGGSERAVAELQVLQMLQVACLAAVGMKARMSAALFKQRLCWWAHSQCHVARGTFEQRLRMEKESFNLLLSCVHTFLVVNEQKAKI